MDKNQSFPPLSEEFLQPPTPTPTPHHFYRMTHSSINNQPETPTRRSTIDTPLSLYASTRAKLRKELESHVSYPSTRRRHTVQVPLSAMCEPQAVLGSIGNPFNSTTKVKSLPLPAIYNRHQFSSRGIRNVGLHTDRYLPISTKQRRWTVSDSLLNLSRLSNRQKEHLLYCENIMKFSRNLQQQREIIPHRVEQSYYMNGHSAQLFNREEIPANELEVLQKIALSQNRHLYYGQGIRSSNTRASRTVQKFERKLQDSISAQDETFDIGDIDVGRYSRASRAVTPGSPIIEESEDQVTQKITGSSKTFVTQENSS